jgi:hypothetical protein
LLVPPLLTETFDAEFVFAFACNTLLEPDCAVADVRSDRAEIRAGLKVPIVAQLEIAARLALPVDAVTVHVSRVEQGHRPPVVLDGLCVMALTDVDVAQVAQGGGLRGGVGGARGGAARLQTRTRRHPPRQD